MSVAMDSVSISYEFDFLSAISSINKFETILGFREEVGQSTA